MNELYMIINKILLFILLFIFFFILFYKNKKHDVKQINDKKIQNFRKYRKKKKGHIRIIW